MDHDRYPKWKTVDGKGQHPNLPVDARSYIVTLTLQGAPEGNLVEKPEPADAYEYEDDAYDGEEYSLEEDDQEGPTFEVSMRRDCKMLAIPMAQFTICMHILTFTCDCAVGHNLWSHIRQLIY